MDETEPGVSGVIDDCDSIDILFASRYQIQHMRNTIRHRLEITI